MAVGWIAVALVFGWAVLLPAAGDANELGQQIFEKRCASCHGSDGKGNAKMAAMLKVEMPNLTTPAGKSDEEVRALVTEGKKPMPAFAKSLSPEELDAVLAHVKSLGKNGRQ